MISFIVDSPVVNILPHFGQSFYDTCYYYYDIIIAEQLENKF